MEKTKNLDGCLSVIAQAFMDSFSLSETQLGKVRYLLFCKIRLRWNDSTLTVLYVRSSMRQPISSSMPKTFPSSNRRWRLITSRSETSRHSQRLNSKTSWRRNPRWDACQGKIRKKRRGEDDAVNGGALVVISETWKRVQRSRSPQGDLQIHQTVFLRGQLSFPSPHSPFRHYQPDAFEMFRDDVKVSRCLIWILWLGNCKYQHFTPCLTCLCWVFATDARHCVVAIIFLLAFRFPFAFLDHTNILPVFVCSGFFLKPVTSSVCIFRLLHQVSLS